MYFKGTGSYREMDRNVAERDWVSSRNHRLPFPTLRELTKVKFFIHPTSCGPSFPASQGLAVESLNVSTRYCPDRLDLSE